MLFSRDTWRIRARYLLCDFCKQIWLRWSVRWQQRRRQTSWTILRKSGDSITFLSAQGYKQVYEQKRYRRQGIISTTAAHCNTPYHYDNCNFISRMIFYDVYCFSAISICFVAVWFEIALSKHILWSLQPHCSCNCRGDRRRDDRRHWSRSHRRPRKFHRSESSMERKFSDFSLPGIECSTERKFHGSESSLYGLFAPGNESAEERKGQLPRWLAADRAACLVTNIMNINMCAYDLCGCNDVLNNDTMITHRCNRSLQWLQQRLQKRSHQWRNKGIGRTLPLAVNFFQVLSPTYTLLKPYLSRVSTLTHESRLI